MHTVNEILEAIRRMPRPERVQLLEQLAIELDHEPKPATAERMPSDSRLELRNGFYVFTGPVGVGSPDHRAIREERADQIAKISGARRG